jgi:hypothetical protein
MVKYQLERSINCKTDKGKVIFVLNRVIKQYPMKAYGWSGGVAPLFLTSALDRCE